MRNCVLLLLLAGIALPTLAAKRVTVAQLELVLAETRGKSEAEVVRKLAELELSERLSNAKLSRWKAESPGPEARQALVALADASVFLDPPLAEIPATATPDLAAQRQIMALTSNYVGRTIHQLPNFFATRVTNRFEETAQVVTSINTTPYQPLHNLGASRTTVLYRDGREVVDSGAVKVKQSEPSERGLSTWGVFGPILGTVILDAAHSSLAWRRWEYGAAGRVAVFHYSVPQEKSHYEVKYCCTQDPSGFAPIPFHKVPGYQGEISVDPVSGTILRLTVIAGLKVADPISRADIMVEYGPVEIGGPTYICPLKSVSISDARTPRESFYAMPTSNVLLNDVEFVDYHLFRATATIVDQETASTPTGQGNGLAIPETSPALPPISASAEDAVVPAAPPSAAPEVATLPAAAPPAATEAPEYTLRPADPIPHVTPIENGFVIKANARLVNVGFVAHDKHGHPVADLKQDQIEVFDNGKKQQVRFFFQASPATASSPGAPPAQSAPALSTATDTFTNQTAIASATPASATVAPSSTVLLLDAAHLAWPDLVLARAVTIKFLNKLAPSQPVALYTMDEIGFHVLVEMTEDHAMLAATLQSWSPNAAAVSNAQEAERRNNQHFDTVMNASSLGAVNGSGPDADSSGGASVDPKLRDFGANPDREALRVIMAVARHLAPVPGHKSILWISGDTALVDWSSQQPGVGTYGMKNKYLDKIADSAGEALNQAHAALYPVDASAVAVGGVDASLGNRNVELSQAPQNSAGASLPGGAGMPRNMTNGRATESMQADMYSIQEPIRRVAESTGGRAVRRASDLGHTLDTILSDTQATYMASFTPDSVPDDTFHKITLKVPDKKGINLRYRSGYLFEKESADPKAKFEDAVWRPVDPIEIGLTAKVISHSPAKLQLMISLKDLALDRQAGHWTDKVDVYLVQREEYVGRANSSSDTIKFDLKSSTYEKMMTTGFAYQRAFTLQPKVSSLRLIVVDENSGRIGSVTLPAAAFEP